MFFDFNFKAVIFVVRFVYLLSIFLITLLGCTKFFFVATNNVFNMTGGEICNSTKPVEIFGIIVGIVSSAQATWHTKA